MSRVSKDYILDTDPPLTLRVRERFGGHIESLGKWAVWKELKTRIEIVATKKDEANRPLLDIPKELYGESLDPTGRCDDLRVLKEDWGEWWNNSIPLRFCYSRNTFEEGINYLVSWIKENNLSLKEDKGKEIEPFTKTTDKDGITKIKSNTNPSVIFCINSFSHNIWIRANQNGFIDLPDCFENRPFLGAKLRDIWGTQEYSSNDIYRRMFSCDFDNPDTYEDRCSYVENWIRENIDGNKSDKEDYFTKTERLVDKKLNEEDIPREVNYSSLISRQCIGEDKLVPKPITFEERVVYLLKQLDEKIDRLEKKIDSWQEKI